jgi:hypothetical protein
MVRFALLVSLAAAACGNQLDVDSTDNLDRLPADDDNAARRGGDVATAGADTDDADDADEDGAAEDDEAPPSTPGDDAAGTDDADANAGPADEDSSFEPGPPPASAGQACVEWTDCGPRFANPNSGFDCIDEVCTCNAEGNWDDACASIGGVWSDEECFCFVSASPAPSEDADTWTADDEDEDSAADRQCWWVWKETCEPDTWVDTSEYEWVCRGSDDCGYEYRAGGYWESGECDGYWIRRCDDGSEKRYGP